MYAHHPSPDAPDNLLGEIAALGNAPNVRRVPLWIVFLLCIAVVAGVWIRGTWGRDFMTPPSPEVIARAKIKATQQLARPSDLFALPATPPTAPVEETTPEPFQSEPPPPPPPPTLPLDHLPEPLPQDFWVGQSQYPAGSFLQAGQTLEAESQATAALTAYERVLDALNPSDEELRAALKGMRRTRALISVPEEAPAGAPLVKLKIHTPSSQVSATRKAARLAAEALAQASHRQLRFEAWITPDRKKTEHLTLSLERPGEEEPASAEVVVTEDVDRLRQDLLSAAFRLVASTLALDPTLRPISQPPEGEPSDDSLAHRITRRAWSHFVPQVTHPDEP
ncbi:hypothetical protein HNR46_002676 [Haloferula luteola]|uniref:Uncharacterized protein n=1 Tax=Haloferula luteola TaxID=595692 RepID=A0A840VI92_9BACT|nr:hypothetical protein [Haloferula luteola]MBB5352431.1 hypothetical protein [Haloferula luteola]